MQSKLKPIKLHRRSARLNKVASEKVTTKVATNRSAAKVKNQLVYIAGFGSVKSQSNLQPVKLYSTALFNKNEFDEVAPVVANRIAGKNFNQLGCI